jgi:hypothetical protein
VANVFKMLAHRQDELRDFCGMSNCLATLASAPPKGGYLTGRVAMDA